MSWDLPLFFSLGEAWALGPQGYKTLRLWLDYDMVDLLMCTGKIKDRQECGKEKDSTINENNLKYKYEQWTLNQICLSTTLAAVQTATVKTTTWTTFYKFLGIEISLKATQKMEVEVQAAQVLNEIKVQGRNQY